MKDEELLKKVKTALGLRWKTHDEIISLYIDEVKSFMISAGVRKQTADSSSSIGVIARGVSDLWNYGNPGGNISRYCRQRIMQLALESRTAEKKEVEKLTELAEKLLDKIEVT